MGTYDGRMPVPREDPEARREDPGVEALDGRPLSAHLRDLIVESIELMRQEIALAKAEAREKVEQAQAGAIALATGTAILTGGLLVLLATTVMAVGLVMPYWAAGLLVGTVFVIAGWIALGRGRRDVRPSNLTPDRTLEEARRDTRLTKEHLG